MFATAGISVGRFYRMGTFPSVIKRERKGKGREGRKGRGGKGRERKGRGGNLQVTYASSLETDPSILVSDPNISPREGEGEGGPREERNRMTKTDMFSMKYEYHNRYLGSKLD